MLNTTKGSWVRASAWAAASLLLVGSVACGDDETSSTDNTGGAGSTSSTNSTNSSSSTTSNGGGGAVGGAGGSATGAGGSGGNGVGGGMADVYPPGPYGNDVGQVITNFRVTGYLNPTAAAQANTQPHGSYSMADIHNSGTSHALIHLASTT